MTRTSIASWNINSVRARIGIVEKFLREEAPDILCLQETKVECALFPPEMFRRLGYEHIVTHGQRMHHGVAIVSKVPLTDVRKYDWQANGEARHVGVTLPSGVRLDNVYIPAGGDIPDRHLNPKFGQKLDFFGRMTEWSGALNGTPTVLTGDFNVAPLESDVWNHKALLDVVSHTPDGGRNPRAAAGGVELGRPRAPLHRGTDAALHMVELPREGLGSIEPRPPARPYVGHPRPDAQGRIAPHRPAGAKLGTPVGPHPADHRVRFLSDAKGRPQGGPRRRCAASRLAVSRRGCRWRARPAGGRKRA